MEKTAFIVEDEQNIREIIACALESSGLKVKGFKDASAMFDEFAANKPDIILLDIMLPGMDGLDALRQLKSQESTRSIPVILLTAKSSEIDKVTGLDLGADDYITKPFGVLELMARVRKALRYRESISGQPDVIEYKGLVLDAGRHEVKADGQPVELTLKEFDLLKKLMENAGRVIVRDKLLDDIWGYGYMGETRTLDMHIRSLRLKLNEAAGFGTYITTVRGVGYKFNA